MHDLYSIYAKVKKCIPKCLQQFLVDGKSIRYYPLQAKMSDIEIIGQSIANECLGIESENWLFAKIKKDYSGKFPNFVYRTRYNS